MTEDPKVEPDSTPVPETFGEEEHGRVPASRPEAQWGARQKLMIGANVATMIVFALAIYLGVNFIGARQYSRQDWTEEKLYTLSAETIVVLENLDREIEVINFYRPGPGSVFPQRIQRQVRLRVDDLLEEYVQHTDKLKIRNIDIDKEPAAAQLLISELELERANLTVFRVGEGEGARRTDVNMEDVAQVSGGVNQASLRRQPARLVAFRGEEQFSSAIRSVLEERATKVLFTKGHGERSPTDFDSTSGFSACERALRQTNYLVEEVNLFEKGAVPGDCDVLVVAAPERDFAQGEIDAIKKYRDNGGNLFVMLRHLNRCNVMDLVADLGVTAAPPDVVAFDSVNYDYFNGQFYLRVKDGLSRSHDITRALTEQNLFVVMPFARPLILKPAEGWNREKILQSYGADQSWGERIVDGKPNMVKDSGEMSGPLTLGVCLSKANEATDALKGRILVIGDADFATNAALNAASNKDLLTNCFDWLSDKGLYFDIAPKISTARLIQLDEQSNRVFFWLWIGMTVFFGLFLGVLVWLIRRS